MCSDMLILALVEKSVSRVRLRTWDCKAVPLFVLSCWIKESVRVSGWKGQGCVNDPCRPLVDVILIY